MMPGRRKREKEVSLRLTVYARTRRNSSLVNERHYYVLDKNKCTHFSCPPAMIFTRSVQRVRTQEKNFTYGRVRDRMIVKIWTIFINIIFYIIQLVFLVYTTRRISLNDETFNTKTFYRQCVIIWHSSPPPFYTHSPPLRVWRIFSVLCFPPVVGFQHCRISIFSRNANVNTPVDFVTASTDSKCVPYNALFNIWNPETLPCDSFTNRYWLFF